MTFITRSEAIKGTKFLLLLPIFFLWLNLTWSQCITGFPNTQDFEASNGGWTTGGTASDWTWGTPAKSIIKNAASGQKCWITGGLTGNSYNNGELAWVKSPCYDFTNLKYPTVGFYAYWETEHTYDGTVLQYSTDNGTTWNNVGSISDPKNCFNLNWYNTSSVKYANGGNGWSGSSVGGGAGCGSGNGSNQWVLTSHTMPYLAGFSKVQFRFLFGAGTSCNNYNGFAFDYFTIGNALPNFASYTYTCSGGNTVNFKGSFLFCPTLTWDFGDPGSGAANNSSATNPGHTFSGPGQYTVKLTASGPDNAPATYTQVITILDLNTQIVSLPLCFGDKTGSAKVTATPNIASLNYSWNSNPVQLTSTATNLKKGTYVVTVSGANVCTSQDNITITEPPLLSNIATTVSPSCNSSNGSIDIVTTGGTAPYSYSWNPSVSTTNSATGLGEATYVVLVTDQNHCIETKSISLTATSGLIASIINTGDATCNGNKNGTATVNVMGGTPPYTYSWSPSGGSGATANALAAGTYTVTIKDQLGCSTSADAVINEPANLVAVINATDAACGNNNGSASAVVTGGTAPYTYAWSPGNLNTSSINNLAPAKYTLTVTDKNNCKQTGTADIAASTNVTLSINRTDVKCFGDKSGSATVTILGGVQPYTISWSNGATGATASGLAKGNYSVTVKDAVGCSNSASVTILEPAAALSVNLSGSDALCNGGKGSIQSTVTGGTPGYQYLWTGGATSPGLVNANPGAYQLSLTDSKGCNVTADYTINEPAVLNVNVSMQNSSCGNNNGVASAVVTGGTAPYTYAWSPGNLNTSSINNLAPAKYTLTVTDKNNCKQTGTADIAASTNVTLSIDRTDVKCFGDKTGSATVTILGGVQPYTISWSNGATGATASGLAKGNYSVTVKDAVGCSNSASVTILEPAAALSVNLSGSDALCNGGKGSIQSTVMGGTPGYQYLWTPGGATSPGLVNANPGAYQLSLTDSKGCNVTADYTINEPAVLNVNVSMQNSSCGNNNGSASAVVTGGTAPYTYAWSPGNLNTSSINNLAPAKYTLTVTDKNNCKQTGTADIAASTNVTLSINRTDVKCFGDKSGSATVTILGGVQPYTISWSNGATGATASGLAKGNYSVTVKDAVGCSNSASVTILEPAAALSVNLSGSDALCNGGKGSIQSTVMGGTPGYQYLWTPGGATSPGLVNANPGAYQLSLTDSKGCNVTADYTINEPAVLNVNVSMQNSSCGNNNGSASAVVTGGTAPYTYAWSPGNLNTSSINNLAPAKYTLTVTDKNNCKQTGTADIAASTNVTLSINRTDVKCFGEKTGSATVTILGGVQPYTISWSNGATGATASGLAKGNYSVTVKDAKGCSANASVTINEPTSINVMLTAVDALCNKGTGNVNCVVTGGMSPYSYTWSNGGTSQSLAAVPAGNYSLNVTDKNGCASTSTAGVKEPGALSTSLNIQNAACGTPNGSIAAVVSGGIAPYTYQWNPGTLTTATIQNLAAGKYTLLVKDKNGCTITDAGVITTTGNLLVQTTATNAACFGATNGSAAIVITGGTPAYTIAWNNGMTTPAISNLAAGNYGVTVKDAGGCSATASVVISEPSNLSVVLDSTAAICNSNDGKITSTVKGGTLPYSFSWQPGNQTTPNLSSLAPGKYTVVVTDKNGCKITARTTITKINPLKINLGKDTSLCGAGSVTLTPGNFSSYLWQNNTIAPNFTATQEGTYWVAVKDQRGCAAADTIRIVNDCGVIWFASAFTPNSDGLNDKFGPLGNVSLVSDFSMTVFNRWGEKVFESYNAVNKWDGRYKGQMLPGAYVWSARYRNRAGEFLQKKGTVVLVR